MGVGKFDPELLYEKDGDEWVIDATGPLELATGENAEEANGHLHPDLPGRHPPCAVQQHRPR